MSRTPATPSRPADAARDLPAASRLTDALSDLCATAPQLDVDDVADEDRVEDTLQITRIEAGKLWLGERGPLKLPKRATDTARIGWEVWVVMARSACRSRWLTRRVVINVLYMDVLDHTPSPARAV